MLEAAIVIVCCCSLLAGVIGGCGLGMKIERARWEAGERQR